MQTAKININTDAKTKHEAELLFNQLGINMTTAINMFLRRAILERGMPFDVSINVPNKETRDAIDEARRIAYDPDAKGYKSIDELKAALEEE